MSLLQNLPYSEFLQAVSALTKERCEMIAKLANLRITFNNSNKPGEQLIKTLDHQGYSIKQFRDFMASTKNTKLIVSYYKPQSKIAILIGNDDYKYLGKLATPVLDSNVLALHLHNLGFITFNIKNTDSQTLADILIKIFSQVEENSYCFIYYAGHGCELCNTKIMLGVDCPTENMDFRHCVTENFILNEVAKCKPELCIFIMDMCRINLDRETNPTIYKEISTINQYKIYKNLLVVCTTQSLEAAYEMLEIECSTTIGNVTYELREGDSDRIRVGTSQYVKALCARLEDNLDISSLLDKVHGDVEQSLRKQRPIKMQCGVSKRSFYDEAVGEPEMLLDDLKKIAQQYEDHCSTAMKKN